MASSASLLLRIVSSSVAAADRAGKIIRDIMNRGELGIVQKGHNDLQTEADRSAQLCIVSSLSRQFPKVAIVGEETLNATDDVPDDFLVSDYNADILKLKCPEKLSTVKEEDVVIWVDPLDGTSEYTQGLLDHVTVLIGIAVNGEAVGGVIHQPYFNYKTNNQLGRTVWGVLGLGAFGITQSKPPSGQRIVTTTRSHLTPSVQAALDAMEPTKIIRVGGAGHKVLMVIEGEAHAYLFASPGCKKWDTCAPEAVLRSIGGQLTDVHGSVYRYHKEVKHVNSGGVVATQDVKEHEWYLSRIPNQVLDSLPP